MITEMAVQPSPDTDEEVPGEVPDPEPEPEPEPVPVPDDDGDPAE